MVEKPKMSNSASQQEIDKAKEQFDAFDTKVKEMTLDRMNAAPKQETDEPHISQKELERSKDTYLKPMKTISCVEKFNDKYRKDYEYSREYVQFIAQNNELVEGSIDLWTKPFAGIPAEYWEVPTNKPVWGPRYLAERIKGCTYHRLRMEQSKMRGGDSNMTYYGDMVAESTIQRLDAQPFSKKKSIFMGASF